MYLEHFGLREAPFLITPHTEFFFAGANRGATLEALIYAITHDEGIVKVSGEVGSGKTMLCRMLLEKLSAGVETVYLANPSLSREEILYAIADELRVPLPDGMAHQQLRALQEKLLEIYAAGRQVVVMIDEAHAMPAETLEEIRLLSNLESNRHKLLHIVLFGQPELDAHLAEPGMRQLKERITHNFALEPLRRTDIGDYLMFRLRAAGYRGPDLFTANAVRLISRASEGLTRRINILADKALLAAFSENRHLIDTRQVRTAIRDAQFNPMHNGPAERRAWGAGLTIAGIVVALASVVGSYKAANAPEAPPATPAEAGRTSTPSAVPPASAPVVAAPVAIASAPPRPTAPTSPAPPSAPVRPSDGASGGGETPSFPLGMPLGERPPTLAERVAMTEEWLRRTPDSHFIIQLLSVEAANQRDVELFLENRARKLDPQQIRVYRSKLSGRDRIGVIYGDYASIEAANAALGRVAEANPGSGPYVRSVAKLR